jgi:hypothetical protein
MFGRRPILIRDCLLLGVGLCLYHLLDLIQLTGRWPRLSSRVACRLRFCFLHTVGHFSLSFRHSTFPQISTVAPNHFDPAN